MQQQVLLDQAGQIIDRTEQRPLQQHVTWLQKCLILMQLLDLNQQQSSENRCILEFNNIAAALPGRLLLMDARQHGGPCPRNGVRPMKSLISLSLLLTVVFFTVTVAADDTIYKPFIVASSGLGTLDEKTTSTRRALEDAGFEVYGQYSPVEGTNVVVVTNDELKQIAAMSDKGGYAAGQRVSVTEVGDTVEVSFVNPLYIQYGYRLEGDMQPVYEALVASLGNVRSCGAGKKKMTAKKLGKFHYMMGMPYFDDPYELGSFASYEEAVAAVADGLAKADDALTQVYRIDIPGKQQTVFGVGMKMTNEDENDIDAAYQMSIVDFEGCKKRAYFPYEILVDGKNVEALHMRFRMAMHFPNLSMAGKHGFTKLMKAPGKTEDAFKNMIGTE